MKKAEEIAKKYLNDKLADLGTSILKYKHIAINLMLEFAKEMCELQKKECTNDYIDWDNQWVKAPYSGNDIILNSKNVCDE